ncbi:NADH-quinone oxidoreductase subunit C [Solitalea koreensis]|uniref:NADH-quinone oxidoreductase subunit C n=1 Tax=Solitalea koreensis TaxID=543615 RepID=A0A521B8T9_9SPHI|nr:NADH-quinone oxidoreductase subunit C [Solitalea koreensis]SMO43489.1 NADH dehydrogenase subunit C [Solitalea koreensis]
MTFQEIKNLLIEKFGTEVLIAEQNEGLQPALVINPEFINKVCFELRDNSNTYFDFLSNLSGIDYGIDKNKIGVVYHLSSIPYNTQLTLKVEKEFDRNSAILPSFPTVSDVWRTADWHEREAYDLLGIDFKGHPDLRRILLPDDWEGYPLRKDYKTAETYKGIKIDY